MAILLDVQNISKQYGNIHALKGVSVQVPKGSIFGILGPNGSGKTTLLSVVLDIVKASQGTYAWVQSKNEQEARLVTGSLLETPNFYPYLSAVENLQISAEIKKRGFTDIDNVLQKVNLYERRHSQFATFSLGMKQRLAIAGALLGNPQVLVLDEPTNGLDPVGISEIRNLIQQLHQEGITILLASHMLDEVEKICTHVAILKQGTLLQIGSVQDVLSDEDWIEVASENMEALANVLATHPFLKKIKKEKYIFVTFEPSVSAEELNKYCYENQIVLNYLQKRKRSLESKFIEITQ
jgi:ABC-type multidrug transport system ATPase subunit